MFQKITAEDSSSLDRDRSYAWLLLPVVFLLTRAIIAPTLFSDPRFWAEEGTNYYAVALHMPFFEYVTSYVFRGNFQFLANLATGLAAQVAPLHAPTVTSFLSMAIFAGVVLQFGYFLRENRVSYDAAMLSMLAWTASPLTTEIFATSTNLQWVGALSATLLCLSRLNVSKAALVAICVWLAACGLTGVPSLLLAPFFLLQTYFLRSRNHLVLFAVLCVCGLTQAGIILGSELSDRDLSLGPRILLAPMMLKTIVLPLFGMDAADNLAEAIKAGSLATFLLVALGCAFSIGLLLHLNRYSRNAFLVAAIWVVISLIQTVGAVGGAVAKLMAISALGGARYCITGYLAIIILLALSSKGAARSVVFSLLVLISVQGIWWSSFEYAKYAHLTSWTESISNCHAAEVCSVPIWPPDWIVNIPANRLP